MSPSDVDVILAPHKSYGFSPKGIEGTWDKEMAQHIAACRKGIKGEYIAASRRYGWPAKSVTDDLRSVFPPHVIVKYKDEAPAFVPAELADNDRKHPVGVLFLVVDFDNLKPGDEEVIDARFAPFQYLKTTTFSHLATKTVIPIYIDKFDTAGVYDLTEIIEGIDDETRAKFDKFTSYMGEPNKTASGRLVAQRPLEDFVRSQMSFDPMKLELDVYSRVTKYHPPVNGKFAQREAEGGIVAIHNPGPPKLRYILRLHTPFVEASLRRTWPAACKAFLAGLPYDRACIDPAHAFYFPSCPASRRDVARYEYHEGDLLDMTAFVPAEDEHEDVDVTPIDASDLVPAFKRAVTRIRAIENDDKFISSFYWQFKRSFRLRTFLRKFGRHPGDYTRPRVVEERREDGDETRCPFVRYHSSYGAKDGAYAQNADDGRRGFVWSCRHDHSKAPPEHHKSTITMLREALSLGWFKRDDFLSDASLFDREALLIDLGA